MLHSLKTKTLQSTISAELVIDDDAGRYPERRIKAKIGTPEHVEWVTAPEEVTT